MTSQQEQIKLRQKLQNILLSFYESSHGTYSELQNAWDNCEDRLGDMTPDNPAVVLFEETVKFTLEVLETLGE